jgi:alpha-ketoglutarate-dependent taurine dioxygenase
MMIANSAFRPFELSDETPYRCWREWKLAGYPRSVEELLVRVRDPENLDADETAGILARCRKANAAVYECEAAVAGAGSKRLLRMLGRRFGLERLDRNLRADEDSITALRVVDGAGKTQYIPYTNRPINWHTDGYYNTPDEQVRGFILYCASAPATGGDNLFLDHEIAYLLMRDENPDYIAALMQPDVMTIPANIEDGTEIRAAQSGPVFSVDPLTGALHMRYTARTRSVAWKDDRITREATAFLADLLQGPSPYIIRHRLDAGQGIICNNILHKREAFTDDAKTGRRRLLYRARYHDRIRDTGIGNTVGEAECSG